MNTENLKMKNTKQKPAAFATGFCFGGDEGDRTPYLLNAMALYVNYLIIIGTLVIIEFMACQSTQKSTEKCRTIAVILQLFQTNFLPCSSCPAG